MTVALLDVNVLVSLAWPNQVTDAHLLALALRHGGRLATFDDGIPGLLPAGADRDALVILPPAV